MLEPLFKKIAISSATLLERDLTQGFACEYCETFKNTYFEEHLKTAAAVIFQNYFPEHLKEAPLHFNIFQFCMF